MNFLGVESQGVSHQLTNAKTDLVHHVEVALVLLISWVLFVVNGCKAVKSTGNLENTTHFVLEECLTAAVMVETEVG